MILSSSSVAEWSEAPSVEPLVVTGSDPALANEYLFAVYSSLYDHSVMYMISLTLTDKQFIKLPLVIIINQSQTMALIEMQRNP